MVYVDFQLLHLTSGFSSVNQIPKQETITGFCNLWAALPLFLLLMEKIQKDTWIRQILCKCKQWPLSLSLVSFFWGGEGWGEREGTEGSGQMSWPCHPLCLLISVSVLLFSTNNSAAHLTHSFITKISHFSMNPSHFWIFPFSHFPCHHFLVSLFFFFSVS